jgi:transposase
LRTDRLGNPLAFTITAGQEHDAPQLTKLIDLAKIKRVSRGRPRLRPDHVAGDKGYDSSRLRAEPRRRGITPVIPARSNRKRKILFDRERYRSRNVIERCFNRLKRWRRLATLYEKHGVNYVAVVLVAAGMHFVLLL